MTHLALIRNNEILSQHHEGRKFTLPDGRVVSPAKEGWSQDGYALVAIAPADPPPEGHRIVSREVKMIDGVPTEVVETAPIPPPPLTFLQLMIGLVTEGWITEAEGDAWLDGTPPPQVDALISQLPAEERFPARARAKRFTVAERDDPLVNGLGQIEGKTTEDLDAFFHQYSQI